MQHIQYSQKSSTAELGVGIPGYPTLVGNTVHVATEALLLGSVPELEFFTANYTYMNTSLGIGVVLFLEIYQSSATEYLIIHYLHVIQR